MPRKKPASARYTLDFALSLLYISKGVDQIIQLAAVLDKPVRTIRHLLDKQEALGLIFYLPKEVTLRSGRKLVVRSYRLSGEVEDEVVRIIDAPIEEMVAKVKNV